MDLPVVFRQIHEVSASRYQHNDLIICGCMIHIQSKETTTHGEKKINEGRDLFDVSAKLEPSSDDAS